MGRLESATERSAHFTQSESVLMSNFDPRLVKRVRQGNPLEASEALDDLVNRGASSERSVVAAIEERIRDGGSLSDASLVRWIIAAAPKSTNVFNASWEHFKSQPDAVLALYRAQVTAVRAVEDQVLHFLDEFGTKPAQPYRPLAYGAVCEIGTARCLPWLKSLQVDLKAESALRRDLATAIPSGLTAKTSSALEESLTMCAAAIAAVEGRSSALPPDHGEDGLTFDPAIRPSRYAATHLDEAHRLASSSSPGSCLNPLRMFAEAMCDELCVRWKIDGSDQNSLAKKLTALKDEFKKGHQWLQARLWALKYLVDFGSHHSEEFVDKLTIDEARLALDLADGIQRAYLALN